MGRLRWLVFLVLMPVIAHEHSADDTSTAPKPSDKHADAPDAASADSKDDKDADTPPVEKDSETSAPAVVEGVIKAIRKDLEDNQYQSIVALLAFVFGCVLVFDGEFCLRWLIACVVFVVVASMAMNQVTSSWELTEKDRAFRYVVGLEAGSIGAFAAFRGMDGMRVCVGALLGVFVAWKSEEFLDEHGVHIIAAHKWVELTYYSLIAILSTTLLFKNKHLKLLAVISAGIGGAFCASAIAFAVTDLATKGYLSFLENAFPGLTPKTGSWVQFFHMLWSTKAPIRGLFVDSRYNPSAEGREFSLDKIADDCLWVVFWLVGSIVQLRRLKKPTPPTGVEEPLLGELPK